MYEYDKRRIALSLAALSAALTGALLFARSLMRLYRVRTTKRRKP